MILRVQVRSCDLTVGIVYYYLVLDSHVRFIQLRFDLKPSSEACEAINKVNDCTIWLPSSIANIQ